MKATKLDERFFESTRGRIVTLLRGTTHTVEELAVKLELTDNAVRAHLATLERDGLVRQSGVRRGLRKPHYVYTLTPEAEQLFPKAYDLLLDQLITVLKGRLAPGEIEGALREVGRRLAATRFSGLQSDDLEERLQKALKAIEALGGSAQIEKRDGKVFLRGRSCPLAAAVTAHPEVCQLAETLIANIVGAQVQEQCDRSEQPQCCFEIDGA